MSGTSLVLVEHLLQEAVHPSDCRGVKFFMFLLMSIGWALTIHFSWIRTHRRFAVDGSTVAMGKSADVTMFPTRLRRFQNPAIAVDHLHVLPTSRHSLPWLHKPRTFSVNAIDVNMETGITTNLQTLAEQGVSSEELDELDDVSNESYLERAARPTKFEEIVWGPSNISKVLLEAMRLQWLYGHKHTPRDFPQLTHKFHDYPAGMQAAAAKKILEVLPGDNLFDPFMGGGTSLIVGMTDGRRTMGTDVSPLAAFVASQRTWRPQSGADALRYMEEAADATAEAVKAGEKYESTTGGRLPKPVRRHTRGGVALPREWEPVQRALAAYLDRTDSVASVLEPGVADALWFCLSDAIDRKAKTRAKKFGKYGKADDKGSITAAATFINVVRQYVRRVEELIAAVPAETPPAIVINSDIRRAQLPNTSFDAVLAGPPYPGVYNYLSLARQMRARSGQLSSMTIAPNQSAEVRLGGRTYLGTSRTKGERWPENWMEGEIGGYKTLMKDPHAFADLWKDQQEAWLGKVAAALRPGGRVAVMTGNGANINTRYSTIEAAIAVGLREVGGCTLKLAGGMSDGRWISGRRTEHLLLFEKLAATVS